MQCRSAKQASHGELPQGDGPALLGLSTLDIYIQKHVGSYGRRILVPRLQWCVEYTPKPTGVTSGWHFPSNMPVADFTSNAATLNTYLNKVGGTIISGWYITSTEATSEGENYCTLKQPNDGTTYKIGKGERRNVRAILTF